MKENSETIKLKQNVKLNAKNAIEKLNLDSKKPGENNVFYYSDKLRENLDEIYSNQGQFSGEE